MLKNNGWYNLSDCAPNVGDVVLAYMVSGDGVGGVYGEYRLVGLRKTLGVREPKSPSYYCWILGEYTFAYDDVKYWMPLPEPPYIEELMASWKKDKEFLSEKESRRTNKYIE